MPQASRYQASVLRLGTPAPSTISPNAADQRREPSALVVMVSDTGSPVAVSRNNCVSPSPGSVPGTWKPLAIPVILGGAPGRSEEHTSELQSLMRISYAVFCLKKKRKNTK